MRHIFLIVAISIISNVVNSQKVVEGTDFTSFRLKLQKDTIDFIVSDTNFVKEKPLFLFCQGSQPVPLFIDFKENDVFQTSLSNFDLNELRKEYYVVVVSIPKTPLKVEPSNLNGSYCYITDSTKKTQLFRRLSKSRLFRELCK